VNDWKFYYDGWEADVFSQGTYVRGAACNDDIRPKERKGSLDAEALKRYGMTADRLRDNPLFIWQLLYPICDPRRSGIVDDKRMPFFSAIAPHTNAYATAEKGWGGGYGHAYKSTTESELVKFLGVPIRNGARNGNAGSIHLRWMKDDPDYDPIIADAQSISRWRQLKQVIKLNNNLASPKRGQPGHNPSDKYDYAYQALVHNMNNITLRADPDAGFDESTWGFNGYCGEVGGRLAGKKVPKGKSTLFCVLQLITHRHHAHILLLLLLLLLLLYYVFHY